MNDTDLDTLVNAWNLACTADVDTSEYKENKWSIEKVTALNECPEDLWIFIQEVLVRAFPNQYSNLIPDGPMKFLYENHRDTFIDRIEALSNRDGRFHHMLTRDWSSEITNRIWTRLESIHGKPWNERPLIVNGSLTDIFVFMLSSDFFFEHWSLLDLNVGEIEKERIQLQSRSIVKQIVQAAGNNNDYFSSSFTEGRIAETYILLMLLFTDTNKNIFEETVICKLLTEEPGYEDALDLFTMFLTMIANDYEVAIEMKIDLKTKLGRIWKEVDLCTYDERFDLQYEASNSDWDQYLKSLTSEFPDFLSTNLDKFLSYKSYKLFCNKMRTTFSLKEVELVRDSFSNYLLSADRYLDPQKVFM